MNSQANAMRVDVGPEGVLVSLFIPHITPDRHSWSTRIKIDPYLNVDVRKLVSMSLLPS